MASYNPTTKVNLTRLFNKSFAGKPNNLKRQLREVINSREFVDDFKNRFIRTIRDNTRLDSKDKNDKSFKPYSKDYEESETFQVLKGSSKVDLTLSGEMMESIEGIKRGSGIVFQMKKSRNKNIAHGHINGSNNLPVRDFLGLPEKDQKQIMKELVLFYSERNDIFKATDVKPEKTTKQTTQQTDQPTTLGDDLFGVVDAGFL